jgi:prepilin-type N-terminal cleavage/methylation domain-containing protein
MYHAPHNRGFTLLEMSVVVTIIALVAAGVLISKSLLREAGLRAIIREQDIYVKSIKEFMDRYQALPGDMSNAETLWGSDANGCPYITYTATVVTNTTTCSGNGNGRIGNCADDLTCSSNEDDEVWRAWQHLTNAGLVEGKYTGVAGGAISSSQARVGLNVPSSKRRPGGWTFLYYTNVTDQAWMVAGQYGHILMFGGDKGAWNGRYTSQPILPVSETSSLDSKVDDGYPTTGIMRAWDDYWMPTSDAGPTASNGSPSAACVNGTDYYTGNDDKFNLCSIFFLLGF